MYLLYMVTIATIATMVTIVGLSYQPGAPIICRHDITEKRKFDQMGNITVWFLSYRQLKRAHCFLRQQGVTR